jgi:membrane-associated phospholipid phosphatase
VPDPELHHDHVRTLTLRVLLAYLAGSFLLHAWNMTRGVGELQTLMVTAVIAGASVTTMRATHWVGRRLGDWLPLLSLPLLYAAVRWSMLGGLHDASVQGWDRALLGTDVARTMAAAMPWLPVSELLHAAYFSYYGILYVPALVLYLMGNERAFRSVALAFTLAMVGSFIGFIVFPVEGPRYAWPAPSGVPIGPARRIVLSVLEAGSTRGTAFPSSHVAIALAIALAVRQQYRTAGLVLLVLTALLGVGAVYGGFHYATDVLAGVALGLGCWGISRAVHPRSFVSGPETEPRVLP